MKSIWITLLTGVLLVATGDIVFAQTPTSAIQSPKPTTDVRKHHSYLTKSNYTVPTS